MNIPPTLSDTGKRVRSYHKSRKEARDFIEQLQGDTPAATVTPTLAMEADKARSLLASMNVDLVQVAQAYVEASTLLDGTGATIVDAARAHRNAWEERNASATFETAVAAYLTSRSDLRDRTLSSYKYTLERVFKPLHQSMLSDISTADLEGILSNKGATAARMHRRNLGGGWRWAAKPPRRWAGLEVMQAVETPRVSSDSDIRTFTPEEAKALLAAAEVEGPAAAVAFAIAIFGGVRMAELERLTWNHVLEDHIEIGRDVAKKHSRRLVPICSTLRSWINRYRNNADNSSQIVPPNWPDVSKSMRRRAGWAVEARLLKDPPKSTRGPWPGNVCRHTCASVQVAIGTTLEELTLFGHSEGHDILRAHYVARLTKKDALKILETGPEGTVIPVIAEVPSPFDKKTPSPAARKAAKKSQKRQP